MLLFLVQEMMNLEIIFCRYDYFGDWNINNDSGPTNLNWKRHTMSHEMGHFFNLLHPWGATNEPGLENNCSFDDWVLDTPQTIGANSACPLYQSTCGSLDNIQNIMDYSSCSHMFTQGQTYRMEAVANSLIGNRWHLWQDDNLIDTGTNDESVNNSPYSSCAPIPDFISSNQFACVNTLIDFQNFTYNYRNNEVNYEWTFEEAYPQLRLKLILLLFIIILGALMSH